MVTKDNLTLSDSLQPVDFNDVNLVHQPIITGDRPSFRGEGSQRDTNDGSEITSTGDNNGTDEDVTSQRGGRGDSSNPQTDGTREYGNSTQPRGSYVDITQMLQDMVGNDSTDPNAYTDALKGLLSCLLGQASDFGSIGGIIKGLQDAFSGGLFGELSDEDKVSLSTSIGSMVSNVMTGMLNNAYNRQNWVMENAYNTPAAQVQRLIDAGINPAYYFGSLNAGNASQIGQSSVESGQIGFQHNTGTNANEKFANVAGGVASLVGSALGVAEAPTTIKGMIASANLVNAQAEQTRNLTGPMVQYYLNSAAASAAQARNLDSNTATNEATRPLTLQQMRSNIDNIESQTANYDADKMLKRQQLMSNHIYQNQEREAGIKNTNANTHLARINADILVEGMQQRWAQMFQDKYIAEGNWKSAKYVADKSYQTATDAAKISGEYAVKTANVAGAWNYRVNDLISMRNRMNTLTMADVQREGNRVQFSLPFVNKLYDHVQTTWYVGADGSFHSASEIQAKFPGIFKGGVNIEAQLAAKGYKQTTLEQNCFNLLKVKAVRDGINWYLSKSPDFNLDFAKLCDSQSMLVDLTNKAMKQYNLQLGNKIGFGVSDMLFNGTGQKAAGNSIVNGSYSDLIK